MAETLKNMEVQIKGFRSLLSQVLQYGDHSNFLIPKKKGLNFKAIEPLVINQLQNPRYNDSLKEDEIPKNSPSPSEI